jgi:hypothetical protein
MNIATDQLDPERAHAIISFQTVAAALDGDVDVYWVESTLIACVRCLALAYGQSLRTILEDHFEAAPTDERWSDIIAPQMIERAWAERAELEEEEHREHCRLAGCTHPAVYDFGAWGWCVDCRAVAFGGALGVTHRRHIGPKP